MVKSRHYLNRIFSFSIVTTCECMLKFDISITISVVMSLKSCFEPPPLSSGAVALAFAVHVSLVVLHAIVLTSKPCLALRPWTHVLPFSSMGSVVTGQVAQGCEGSAASLAGVATFWRGANGCVHCGGASGPVRIGNCGRLHQFCQSRRGREIEGCWNQQKQVVKERRGGVLICIGCGGGNRLWSRQASGGLWLQR